MELWFSSKTPPKLNILEFQLSKAKRFSGFWVVNKNLKNFNNGMVLTKISASSPAQKRILMKNF